MKTRELSKLQIRAEVMPILQKMTSLEDIPKSEQDKYLIQLKSIENKDYLIELLLKEFATANSDKGQVISLFLIELGNAENLKIPLWEYIKNPKIKDEIKDLAGIILRSIGETCEPEEFLNYFQDPKTIVDKETKKLLETTQVNPEAQIDFLDFLFSLPENEQINLIESLKEDFPGEHLVNLLVPAIEYQPSQNIQEIIIKTLGKSRTKYAVPTLNDIIKYSNNEILIKLALKNLNILKFAGIDIEKSSNAQIGDEVANISKFYKCCVSNIDGNGNQGIIFSRIKPNEDILMFSVVINDITGIVDCFGFNGISIEDLDRIIKRFAEDMNTICVSAEYCKYKLDRAERISKINNSSISYEYSAWKSLVCDIKLLSKSPETQALNWVKTELKTPIKTFLAHPNFKHWFFEKNDNEEIEKMINSIIVKISKDVEHFIKNSENLVSLIDENISAHLNEIFDEETIAVYVNRLLDCAYLFNEEGFSDYRDLSATIANGIQHNRLEYRDFTKEILKKTVYEFLINHKYSIEDKKNSTTVWLNKKNNINNNDSDINLSEEHLDDIINILSKDELS